MTQFWVTVHCQEASLQQSGSQGYSIQPGASQLNPESLVMDEGAFFVLGLLSFLRPAIQSDTKMLD